MIIGTTHDGRPVEGLRGTERLAVAAGKFTVSRTDIWPGGDVTMPYWANPNNSRHLTLDELNQYCDWPGKE